MHLVVLINARYWCAAKRTVTMDRFEACATIQEKSGQRVTRMRVVMLHFYRLISSEA